MRHLRRFDESSTGCRNDQEITKEEVKDFCEINLAYLVDEGLEVIVDDFGYGVILSLKGVDSRNKKWIDIKDHIIPFLIRLKSQYELKTFDWVKDSPNADIIFVTSMKYGKEDEGYSDYYNSDDVINDRVRRDWAKFTSIYKVNEISFLIKNKKLA